MITQIEVRQAALPMVEALSTAHGRVGEVRRLVFLRVQTDEGCAWGEAVALNDGRYNGESSDDAYALLETVTHANNLLEVVDAPGNHQSVRAAVEMALLDIDLRRAATSLAEHVGATAATVRACAVVGLGPVDATLELVALRIGEGYRDIKVKIRPGHEVDCLSSIRERWPNLTLRVDANGSYDWHNRAHVDRLLRLNDFKLALIEQPLPVAQLDEVRDARLALTAPVALDESIASVDAGLRVIHEQRCDVVVIKAGNVGGIAAAQHLLAAAQEAGVQASIGGMVEGGLSRAVNLALAATPAASTHAAEVSPDGRWFSVTPTRGRVDLHDGSIAVPAQSGIGASIDEAVLDACTIRSFRR